MKNISNQIVAWLKNYAVTNNRKSLVVGVSGGVDSALVSTLCAMTEINTACVILPCHSKQDGLDNAKKHIDWLKDMYPNVYDVTVDLTPTYDALQNKSFRGLYPSPLALANTKSRLRMVALYQIATPSEGLVVGTGNKVEDFGVGFFTKYGDGGVDLSPIGDLTKTEVREMCKALDILPELTNAIPTDGLWEDTRTDEQQLGASYEELEWAMDYLSEPDNYPLNPASLSPRQNEVLASYNKWHKAGQHKLNPIPVFKPNEN